MPTITKTFELHTAQGAFRASPAIYRGFVGGVGAGKSFVGAYDLLRRAKPNRLYMVVAPTYPMMRDASLRSFLEIARQLQFLRKFNKSDMIATLGNGAEAIFRSAEDPERLRGPNLSGVWMDEASLMEKGTFEIIIGRLREAGEQGWLSGTFTPKGKLHWTYKQFGTGKPNTAIFHATTNDNPFIISSFSEVLGGIYQGAFKQQELGGEFVDEDDSFLVIPPAWVAAGIEFRKRLVAEGYELRGPRIGGLDIAEEGSNDTILTYRRLFFVEGDITWSKCNTTITAWRAASECERLGIGTLNYDADGVGTGPKGTWEQSGEMLKFTPAPISSGAAPSELYWPDGRSSVDLFHNRRAELWWLLRRRFERTYEFIIHGIEHPIDELIAIPDDERLQRELSEPKLDHTDRGKIKIESKQKMRDRGIASPDKADSLVYCFVPSVDYTFAGSPVNESVVATTRGAYTNATSTSRDANPGPRHDREDDGNDQGGGDGCGVDWMAMRF